MGELEGAQARLEWDRMPRKALHSKACGGQGEDFCLAKVTAFLQAVEKSRADFFRLLEAEPKGSASLP